MASKAAYGSNPHLGVAENANRDWGPYQWPGGVPASLLGDVPLPWEKTVWSQGIRVRKELVNLWTLKLQIAKQKYGRTFERGYTGAYENRSIGGGSTASNHSKGRSCDYDAQFNPQSNSFICDLPPGLVADWESIGFYWGGRYEGVRFDTMHFTYIGWMTDVASDEARARAILHELAGGIPERPSPTPPSPSPVVPMSEEDDDMFWMSSPNRPSVIVVGGKAAPFPSGPGYDRAAKGFDDAKIEHYNLSTDEAYDVVLAAVSVPGN